jgi:hypothetical protein
MTPVTKQIEPVVPSAGGGASAAAAKPVALTDILGDGDEIVLAFRPSPWFIVLISWPVLSVAAALVILLLAAERFVALDSAKHLAMLVCVAGAMLRLTVACFQWMGRLYVLTNRRVLRVCGLLRVDVYQCLLRKVRRVSLTTTVAERMLALGSLCFEVEDQRPWEAGWTNISRPAEVRQMVEEAIRRSR